MAHRPLWVIETLGHVMSFVEDIHRAVSRAEAQVQGLGFSVLAEFHPAPMENAPNEAAGRIGLSMPTVSEHAGARWCRRKLGVHEDCTL